MITGLNPFTVLLFAGAVLSAFALAAAYVFARITENSILHRPVGFGLPS